MHFLHCICICVAFAVVNQKTQKTPNPTPS